MIKVTEANKNSTNFTINYECTHCDTKYSNENVNQIKLKNIPELALCDECLNTMVVTVTVNHKG